MWYHSEGDGATRRAEDEVEWPSVTLDPLMIVEVDAIVMLSSDPLPDSLFQPLLSCGTCPMVSSM